MVRKTQPTARREDVCYIREGGRAYCIDPLSDVLAVLAKRWSLFVLCVVGNQRGMRFNELKRNVPGIAARALSERLGEMQRLGLVEREIVDEGGAPGVRYALTEPGRSMRRSLVPFLQWAETRAGPAP